jgi:uridine kinase
MNIDLNNSDAFTSILFAKMKLVHPGIESLELYEFRYGLNNLEPEGGWSCIDLEPMEMIEQRVNSRAFYDSIQIKPVSAGKLILDEQAQRLTCMLLVGLATCAYPVDWVLQHFYFDMRGFYFLHRTKYLTDAILTRFGGQPYRQFPQKQKAFASLTELGYKDFKEANTEVDAFFIDAARRLTASRGTPCILAIAGPTAAGKTEIVDRLKEAFTTDGKSVTSVELDNFLTDRDEREARKIFSQGKKAMHLGLLCNALEGITAGKPVITPRYDFIDGTSSHRLDGTLKPGKKPVEISPADIIFIEGNFPFLIDEIAHLIGIKVVYLTDDPIRMLRKWRRDIDLRMKYEPNYFRNRWFKEQFLMAEIAYRPQMELCDMFVDTTGAAVFLTPQTQATLNG